MMNTAPKKGARKRNLISLLNRYYDGLLIVMMIGLAAYALLFIVMLLF